MTVKSKEGLALLIVLLFIGVFSVAVWRNKPKPVEPTNILDAPITFTEVPIDLPAPKDAPPERIKVGPYHWTVKYNRLMPMIYGNSDLPTLTIRLDPYLPPDQLKETLLHEIFHACMFVGTGGQSTEGLPYMDDQLIEATVPTLLQVMRDNPELVKWLQKEKHEERVMHSATTTPGRFFTGTGIPPGFTDTVGCSHPIYREGNAFCPKAPRHPGRVQE